MFDNKIMADQARNWLKSNVVRKPKGDEWYPVIFDFKKYPNKQLLPSWKSKVERENKVHHEG